jgi:hypothetical protein
MNYPKLYSVGLLLIICCTLCQAQEDKVQLHEPDLNKPALFKELPNKIAIDINEFKNLLSPVAAKGNETSCRFLDKKLPGFNGKIVSATSKYNNSLRSVVVRSSRFNGATLTLSSFTASDGTTRYSGRIVSFDHDDVYVLEKDNNEYFLIKKKFNELVVE